MNLTNEQIETRLQELREEYKTASPEHRKTIMLQVRPLQLILERRGKKGAAK